MKKQFILIMTDTQRTDWLSCYGEQGVHTPHLQAFADQGLAFTRAYDCQAVCSPARSALFTGSYPHTNGMEGNDMYLREHIKTVGQRLTAAGIKTGYVGKWHLDGGDYFGTGQCPPGWDDEYWYDMRRYLNELEEKDPPDVPASRRFDTIFRPGFSREFTYGHRCAQRAKEFIERYRDRDFFLVLSFDEPHHPSLCPPEYYHMYRDYLPRYQENMADPLEDKPLYQRLWAEDPNHGCPPGETSWDNPEGVRRHLAAASFVDTLFGEVMEKVDALAPEALVIFTSDHGDMGTNHRLKGKGCAMYDENIRIPFLVRWTGTGEKGILVDHPVSHINLTPTALDFFGVKATSYIEGKSILPTLKDPSVPANDRVFIEFNRFQITRDTFGGFQPVRAVCDGRYKLILNLMDRDELYDLKDDPGEMRNLIGEKDGEEIRDGLHDAILVWQNETFDPYRGYQWECRSWRREAKPSLKNTGLARHRWDEAFEEPQRKYTSGLPLTGDRTYSQYK